MIKKNLRLFRNRAFAIFPYLAPIKNRYSLLFSLLIGRSQYEINIDEYKIHFPSSKFHTMLCFLGLLSFSTNHKMKSENEIEISLDMKNTFIIPLKNMTFEDENLLETLFYATKFGADFITDPTKKLDNFRDKTFRIAQIKDKKIIETRNGIKFYMDSIHPGNTIMETFVENIHQINSDDNWENKTVIDIGAECGDTPLYYASMGAKVYAFEPMISHFEAMLRNIELNPTLSKQIVPVNAAMGIDGTLTFNQASLTEISGGASFVYDLHDSKGVKSKVKGYSLESILKEFNIEHVDLLKTDCKGCEFFLNENALKKVERVKIEYVALDKSHRLEVLMNTLEKAGFECSIYRIDPFDSGSNKTLGHIFGIKKIS